MRAQRDLAPDSTLLFDVGDAIKAGNLAVPLRTEPVWGWLADAGVDAGTLGNRESHVLEAAFRRKIEGARHPLVVVNLVHRDGTPVLPGHLVLDRAGVRIGLIGAMVPMVTDRMRTTAASAYRWTPPIPAVAAAARELKPQVDVLIALTHLGFRQDQALAEAVPELDWIFGGHSHTVLEQPVRVGNTLIAQGGSHGRFLGRYQWSPQVGLLSAELLPIPKRR